MLTHSHTSFRLGDVSIFKMQSFLTDKSSSPKACKYSLNKKQNPS